MSNLSFHNEILIKPRIVKLMLDKFRKYRQIKHFLAYCASYFVYGLAANGLGPLIPYLSGRSGIIETDYSFLFSCRSFGMLGGAMILKLLQKGTNISHHGIIMGSSILIAINSVRLAWSESLFLEGFWMVMASIGYVSLEVKVNICILMTNPQEDT